MELMKNLITFICLLVFATSFSQNKKEQEELSITPLIDGTLFIPKTDGKLPLAIIIGGSGPTDRNGNQQMLENNSLKLLAEGLFENNIATFRYDKRIFKQMKSGSLDEKTINFKDFIDDANAVLAYFEKDERFSKIYILGHSQGSLIGMITAQNGADGFISIAGAGQKIDDVIVAQIGVQAPSLRANAQDSFDDLRVNGVALNYDPNLASIFRESIQPFILSWMEYDPKIEIVKLNMPVLILNGDNDMQVLTSEAELLKAARPNSELKIIPKMNHIFKKIEGDTMENTNSYNNPDLPVMPELIELVSDFINK